MAHYEVLGVDPSASSEEVRRAYLDAARRHHPDLVTGGDRPGAERRMQEVNQAWAVLGDPVRRRRYDASLGLPAPGEVPRRAWAPVDDHDDGIDPRDLVDETEWTPSVPRSWQVLPPLLLLAGLGGVLVGSFTAVTGLLSVGVVAVAVGAFGFVALPLLTLLRRRRSAPVVPGDGP